MEFNNRAKTLGRAIDRGFLYGQVPPPKILGTHTIRRSIPQEYWGMGSKDSEVAPKNIGVYNTGPYIEAPQEYWGL
jgi:hypothetical protein